MAIALLIARLLLALVFVVAGLGKLADRQGSRQAAVDFGVPGALATPLAVLLPLAELAVATTLIPTTTAWWGGVGALSLLLLFGIGIGVNLARGRKPDCRCFGQLHSTPAGWSTLARNGVLAGIAGLLVWQGTSGVGVGPSVLNWLTNLSAAQALLLIGGLVLLGFLVAQWWFLVHLLRQNGRLLVRLEVLEARLDTDGAVASRNGAQQQAAGLPVGSKAPDFSLSGLYGETLTLGSLRAPGKPVILLFTDPNCGPCTTLLPEIGRWQQEHAERLTISLISRGDPEENRFKSQEHGLRHVLLQEDWEVSDAYQARGTPTAVLVLSDGRIGSPVAGGTEGIRALLTRAVEAPDQLPVRPAAQGEPCPNCGKVHPAGEHAAQRTRPAGPRVGEPAPEIRLEDLEGNDVELADFRGEETLVLFWNPGCGFCQKMLPDLKEWEADPPEEAPKLLVISGGTKEVNEAMDLSAAVVLDQDFAAGRAFGAAGTPSAVLVDAEGRIASEVSVGAPAILELVDISTKEA